MSGDRMSSLADLLLAADKRESAIILPETDTAGEVHTVLWVEIVPELATMSPFGSITSILVMRSAAS